MNKIRCKAHQKDGNNNEKCQSCIESYYQNEIMKIEEIINEQYMIMSNLKFGDMKFSENKLNILQSIKSMKQQKIKLTNNFNERNNKYSNQKFRLFNEYPMKHYFSFAFFQELLFAGGFGYIKLFKFNNGFKLLQTLTKHTSYVYSLIFMNKSNLLVSGSHDKQIIIWNKDQNSHWNPYQILEGHLNWVRIINNETEDLLISGGTDQLIKFWKKIKMNWRQQQSIQTKLQIQCLSLNKSSTKLISCGLKGSNDILVMEWQQEKQQWSIAQVIEVNCGGRSLSFITDSLFVFQGEQESMEIFQFQQDKKKFIKEKQIEVQKVEWQYYFTGPSEYIQSKGILIIKDGNYLNCFGINENQNFTLYQTIEFLSDYFFWIVSHDGQFLVTLDQNEIMQLRRLQNFN